MMNFRMVSVAALGAILATGLGVAESRAADKAQIQQAIAKGAAAIKAHMKTLAGAEKSLAAVALLKAGEPHNSPFIVDAVATTRGKVRSGAYQATGSHYYEAAVDATLLADVDPEAYKVDIQAIASYLIQGQSPDGHWNYPEAQREAERTGGDISVTHYACLGLWAAARAGVEIDPQVWVRVAAWTAANHNADGGYAYNPGVNISQDGMNSTMNMSVNGAGIMCIAMLNIDPSRIPDFEKGSAPPKQPGGAKALKPGEKPASAIESVDLDLMAEEQAQKTVKAGRIPEAAFPATKNAINWVATRFAPENTSAHHHRAYYYYSLERMGALSNVSKLNGRDWFNECADHLISTQKPDGSWTITQVVSSGNDTSFCVLFLTRSTGKLIKRVAPTPEGTVGGGLLSGGRGLPDDLTNVDSKGNVKKTTERSSLDDLLKSLANPETLEVGNAQAEIVEQIQLGDKTQLIGKKDLLIKLMDSPKPEIRQTAVWAIGRSGNLSLARLAVKALEDKDSSVMVEAHLALCWTARKPKAFKLSDDPLEGLPPDASADQQSAAVDSWRRQAIRLWGEWYLRNRPYAERGDEFETDLRNRLLELQ